MDPQVHDSAAPNKRQSVPSPFSHTSSEVEADVRSPEAARESPAGPWYTPDDLLAGRQLSPVPSTSMERRERMYPMCEAPTDGTLMHDIQEAHNKQRKVSWPGLRCCHQAAPSLTSSCAAPRMHVHVPTCTACARHKACHGASLALTAVDAHSRWQAVAHSAAPRCPPPQPQGCMARSVQRLRPSHLMLRLSRAFVEAMNHGISVLTCDQLADVLERAYGVMGAGGRRGMAGAWPAGMCMYSSSSDFLQRKQKCSAGAWMQLGSGWQCLTPAPLPRHCCSPRASVGRLQGDDARRGAACGPAGAQGAATAQGAAAGHAPA